jgi:hypothetical protein
MISRNLWWGVALGVFPFLEKSAIFWRNQPFVSRNFAVDACKKS